MKPRVPAPCHGMAAVAAVMCGASVLLCPEPLRASLLSSLEAFHSFQERIPVGHPGTGAADGEEGPKCLATADFNGDERPDLAVGNLDGTVTVLLAQGGGHFASPIHLTPSARELRSVVAADLNGDSRPDIAAASPQDGQIAVFFNTGEGAFEPAPSVPGWIGVRSLAAGDFDGDGVMDLAAAGPGVGVRHFRGLGQGAFRVMGDLPRLSPKSLDLTRPRPVYAMRTLRSRDGQRDELLVTHADSPVLWILSTVVPDRSHEPPLLERRPEWILGSPPVVINEVQVHNSGTLLDEDGTAQPWLELLNRSGSPVPLRGWKLRRNSATWSLPAVTLEPGRFLTVFLSGKDRASGPALHASFLLEENDKAIHLEQPGPVSANTIDLPAHAVTGVSRGLAPDNGSVKWFDIPSPGAENNAGLSNLDHLTREVTTTLTITPAAPGPGERLRVRVTTPPKPTGSSSVKAVWFAVNNVTSETYHLLRPVAPGLWEEELPPGAYADHRVLARIRDDPPSTNDYTVELYHAGMSAEGSPTPAPGCLVPVASVPCTKSKSFETAPILNSWKQPGAAPDLVYANDDEGLLRILPAAPDARRFFPLPAYEVQVPGVLRDVKLGDLDADGWLDALAVLRDKDVAVTCRNGSGVLAKPSGELLTGASPREAVVADFNGDALPDAAVINRESSDVSILLSRTAASGLVSSDQTYSVDGDVAAMAVQDFNGDTRADVLQLLRASSELSLRLAGPDGKLAPPAYHPVGAQGASAMAVGHVNDDLIPDVVTANLATTQNGSVSVALGLPDGGFAAPHVIDTGAGMFAIALADFNNDGNADLATGLWDCRVKFFLGTGQGDFIPAPELPVLFILESRVMVTADFDQDGDIDIAGAGIEGDMATLENNLNQRRPGPHWIRRHYPQTDQRAYGANRIGLAHLNDDDDWDLVIGAGAGILLFEGREGMEFRSVPLEEAGDPVTGHAYAVSDVLSVDINGDDLLDMVAACSQAACLDVLTSGDDGRFVRTYQADVPSSRFLGTGDLDGDRKPDLVGCGDVLWTVLSSRPPELKPPGASASPRARTGGVVINEVLPRNTAISVNADNRRNSDFLEVFNGGPPVDLTGWKVRIQSSQEGVPVDRTWTIPPLPLLGTQERQLIIFAELDTLFQPGPAPRTGFTLPAEGGTLTLLLKDNSQADRVVYPRLRENVSWSRFLDGHPSFHASPVPTPGLANADHGRAPPEVELIAPSPSALRPGQPIIWAARGRDDAGIISLSLIYNRLDAPWPEPKRVNLYDNGEGADATPVDGWFHGTMNDPLPDGAQVQFYLEAIDLSGARIRMPEVAELSGPDDRPVAWSFAITAPPTLEISEVCARNDSLLRDERGGYSDYVKVRNTGAAPVNMSNVVLAHSPLSDSSGLFSFPPGLTLAPGAEATVFADGNPSEGPMHAPFTLSAEGETLSLFAVLTSGARNWIDSLSMPPSGPDARFMFLPGTEMRGWIGPEILPEAWGGTLWDKQGLAHAAVRFFAETGRAYRIEGDEAGGPVEWSALSTVIGDGTMKTVTMNTKLSGLGALRCVRQDQFQMKLDAAMPGYDAATATPMVAFFGSVAGAVAGPFEVVLELSETADFSSPVVLTAPVSGTAFEITATGLRRGVSYHYRALVPGVGGGAWSAPTGPLTLPDSNAGMVSSLQFALYYSWHDGEPEVSLMTEATSPLPEGSSLWFLVGPRDEFDQVQAWPIRAAPAPSSTPPAWATTLTDLMDDREYFARVLVSTPAGDWVSPQRIRFRPLPRNNAQPARLLISEIMYHPPPPSAAEAAAGYDDEDFEFVELHNPSEAPVDLSGMWFDGIELDFPASGAPVIPAGGYAVIAAHPHAFALRYGADIPLAGWTLHPFRRGKLSNGSELLRLHGPDGKAVTSVFYTDLARDTDGDGYSLQWSQPYEKFVTSAAFGGTPGVSGLVAYTEWLKSHFNPAQINQPFLSAMRSDPDRDGLTNHMEFVGGTDPRRPDSSSLPRISKAALRGEPSAVTLTFDLDRLADHPGMVLQYSRTLGPGSFWEQIGRIHRGARYEGVGGGTAATSLTAGIATLEVTLSPGELPGPRSLQGFFRLQIVP